MFDRAQEQDSSSSATPINAKATNRPLATKQPQFYPPENSRSSGKDIKLFVRDQVWPGTESNCRHEDFQSSYRSETMCHHRSLLVSIQAFNGGVSPSILPIRTHSNI